MCQQQEMKYQKYLFLFIFNPLGLSFSWKVKSKLPTTKLIIQLHNIYIFSHTVQAYNLPILKTIDTRNQL